MRLDERFYFLDTSTNIEKINSLWLVNLKDDGQWPARICLKINGNCLNSATAAKKNTQNTFFGCEHLDTIGNNSSIWPGAQFPYTRTLHVNYILYKCMSINVILYEYRIYVRGPGLQGGPGLRVARSWILAYT